jgi:hypothetical protein
MARCLTAFLARSVAIDPFTNALTVHDIAESLQVETTEPVVGTNSVPQPIAPFGYVFVVFVERSNRDVPEEPTGRVVVFDPAEHELAATPVRIDLKTALSARNLTLMPVFPYTGAGYYNIRMDLFDEGGSTPRTVVEYRFHLDVKTVDRAQMRLMGAPPDG